MLKFFFVVYFITLIIKYNNTQFKYIKSVNINVKGMIEITIYYNKYF